jgi:hypothetical protein
MEGKIPDITQRRRVNEGSDKIKKMVFYSNEESRNVVKRIVDTTKNGPNLIQISNETIRKVYSYENKIRGLNKRIVYHRYWGRMIFSKILFYLFLLLLAVAIIVLIFYGILLYLFGKNDVDEFFGCYIATMVYGSYDAPEVLVLRKFRDEKLAPHFFGRVFIRIYYTFSPIFVKIFKKNKPVNRMIKRILDKWVSRLQAKELAKVK